MAEEDVEVRFGGSIEGLQAAVSEAQETVEGLTAPLTELQKSFGEISEAFAAAFAVEKITEFISETTEAGAAVEHMSQQLGLSAEQVSVFSFAAGAMGISSESAGMALEHLERNMATASSGTGPAAAAFKALGISVTDSSGHLKSLDAILPEIADKFEESANGPAKTAIAMDLLGRAGAQMIPFLNLGRAGLAQFNRIAQETGSIITAGMSEGMEKTAISTYTLGKATEGVGLTLYEAFKPAIDSAVKGLIDLVEGFNDGLKGAGPLHDALTVLVVAVDSVESAFTLLSLAMRQSWGVVRDTVDVFNIGSATISKVLADAFVGNLPQLEKDFRAGMDQMVAIITDRGHAMEKAAADTVKTIQEQFSNVSGASVDTSGGPAQDEGKKKQLDNPGAAGQSRVGAWRDELDQKLMAEQNYFADSKAEELAFWQAKLALTTAGSKEQLDVERNIYSLSKALAQQKRQEDDAIAREDADTQLQIGKIKLQQERDELDAEVAAHKITADQKIAILKKLADQEYQLDLQALLDQMNTLAGQPAAYQKVYDQILILKQKFNAQMAALDRQAADADKQQLDKMTQNWMKAMQPITSAFNAAINGMIQGTTSLNQAMAKIAQSILMSFVEMAEKSLEKWVATELAKTAATQGGVLQQIAAWITGETSTDAIGTANAATQVGQAAAPTYANAFAALSATPVVGPANAPEGAAAAVAAMLSGAAGFMSAAGGAWELPSDMMVQAHARESIIPASIAAPMRQFFAGGAAGGAVTNHFNQTVHVNGAANPGATSDAVVAAMRRAVRTGAFGRMARA